MNVTIDPDNNQETPLLVDAETLAAAVQQLIAPDQSAAMAHAAWDVASQGAAVTD